MPPGAPGAQGAAATIRDMFKHLTALLALACGLGAAKAAPYTPAGDAVVLERVPARASDPGARELAMLRVNWRGNPQDLDSATRLAWRYQQEVAATGDPRYMGYIQATLAPWWALPEPPVEVRVLRAVVLQFDHRFEPALKDLASVLAEDPENQAALAWQLAIQLVQADYAAARQSCEALAPQVSTLLGAACRAQVDAATGRAAGASAALRAALQREQGADAGERQWSLTRLAEMDERRGDFAAAEAAFKEAEAAAADDVYLQAAHADFLLDRGRAPEVLQLLKDRGRADVLLLRLALAAKATGDSQAAALARDLFARFDAARLRGDTSHRKEEARAALALHGDTTLSLRLARENWAEQREAADARVLLEAALAARNKAAAEPVLQWLATTGFESVQLRALADRVRGLP
jgi:CRP-like cAMP-binding protein